MVTIFTSWHLQCRIFFFFLQGPLFFIYLFHLLCAAPFLWAQALCLFHLGSSSDSGAFLLPGQGAHRASLIPPVENEKHNTKARR